MKQSRSDILAKTNGRCGYCGVVLDGKFQIDHIVPKYNFYSYAKSGLLPDFIKHLTPLDVEHADNKMAACCSCNNYKSTFSLEMFREQLGLLVGRVNNTNTIYRIAKRFGQIQETPKPIIFYFETLKSNG